MARIKSQEEYKREESKRAARQTVLDRVDFLETVAKHDPITYRHLNAWQHGYLSFEEMLMLCVKNHIEHKEEIIFNASQREVTSKIALDTVNEINKEKGRIQRNFDKYAQENGMTRVEKAKLEQVLFNG